MAFLLSFSSGCDQQQDSGVGVAAAPLTAGEGQDEAAAAPPSPCGGDCAKECTCPHKGKAGCDGNCDEGCSCKKGCTCPHK